MISESFEHMLRLSERKVKSRGALEHFGRGLFANVLRHRGYVNLEKRKSRQASKRAGLMYSSTDYY